MWQEAEHWIKDIEANAPSNIILALAGNKCDMIENQEISLEDTKAFTMKHGIELYNECSAKQDLGINDIFMKIVTKIDENSEKYSKD